jgi:hypothetical protein
VSLACDGGDQNSDSIHSRIMALRSLRESRDSAKGVSGDGVSRRRSSLAGALLGVADEFEAEASRLDGIADQQDDPP